MKKISYFIFLIILLTFFCACSIVHEMPSTGIWYCEQLKVVLEFKSNISGRWYISDTEYVNLQIHCGYDAEMILYYIDEQGQEVTVYSGFYKYKKNELLLYVYSKINLDDPYSDCIEVNNEKFIFNQIEGYKNITQ